MHLTKLIATLQQLKPTELKQLAHYIRSPYFKTTEPAIALFHYLHTLPPSYPPNKINEQTISQQSILLNTASKQAGAATALRKTITAFIAQQQWEQHPYEPSLHYLKAFKQHHLFNDFASVYHQTQKQLNADPDQTAEIFYQRHRLEELKFNGYDAKQNRTIKNDISPVLKTLDEFYALHKLRYICEAEHRKQWFNIPYKTTTVKPLLQILKPYTNPKYPYVYLFVQVYLMLTATNQKQKAKHYSLIKQYTVQLPPNKQWNEATIEAAQYTRNYCTKCYNGGQVAYGKEYLWWMEQMLERKLILDNGKMQPILFRNILTIAAQLNYEPAWLQKFTGTYLSALPAETQLANHAFAKGLYHYAKKDFAEAGNQFSQANIANDLLHNCSLKRWCFMCQYESRENPKGLEDMLNTYQQYVYRHTEIQHFKPLFDKFISYAKKLLKAYDKDNRKRIALALQKEKPFPGKDWLLLQLSE